MRSNTKNRLLAGVLALVMVLGLLPMGALAAGIDDARPAIPLGEEAVSAKAAELPVQAKLSADGDGNAWEIAADDASRDIAAGGYVVTAASTAEGALDNVKDGNTSSFWHANYNATAAADRWIQIDLGSAQRISALRYIPRCDVNLNQTDKNSTGNGYVTEYKVEVKENEGDAWATAATGTWNTYDSSKSDHWHNQSWQVANFDQVVTARYVKLTGVHTDGGSLGADKTMHAAELRVVAAPEETGPVAVNVIEDPGFENTNPVYSSTPGTWQKGGDSMSRSTEQVHTGTYSLKLAGMNSTKQTISRRKLQSGTYTLSVWMYRPEGAAASLEVKSAALSGTTLASLEINDTANTGKWAKYSVDFVYKKGVQDPAIIISDGYVSNGQGWVEIYIDDVSVTLKEAAATPDPAPVAQPEPGEGQHYAYLSVNDGKWGLSTQPYTSTFTSLQGMTIYKVEGTKGLAATYLEDITDGVYVIAAPGSGGTKFASDTLSYSADNGDTAAHRLSNSCVINTTLYSVNSAYEVRLTQNRETGGWTIRPVADATKYLNIGAGKQDTFEELPFGAQADATEFVFLSADEANADSAEAYKTGYMNIAAIVNDAPTPVDPPVPGEGQQYAYLSIENEQWGVSAQPYTWGYNPLQGMTLYRAENASSTSGTLVTSPADMTDGVYAIVAPGSCTTYTYRSNALSRSASTEKTGVLQFFSNGTVANTTQNDLTPACLLQFTQDRTTGGWTIQSVADPTKYLNLGAGTLETFEQLPFGDQADATEFVFLSADEANADSAEAYKTGYMNIAAIVDAAEVDPPAPARTLEQAIADTTTDVHYLTGTPTGGNGWMGSVNEAKAVELLVPAVTENITTGTAIALTGSITSGSQYVIRGANFTNGTKCDMHISAPNTNQCGAANTTTVKHLEHLFTFTAQEDGTHKISNGTNFLTTDPTTVDGRPHFLFDATGSKYGVTAVEGQEGSYYIWWETEKAVEPNVYTPEQAAADGKTVKYLAFTGGTAQNRWWDASGAAGDTAKIQLYSAAGAETSSAITLDTDGIEAGNYVINFDTGDSGRQAVMHYSDPATNQCGESTTTVNHTLHLFTFAAAAENEWDNAFTIAPNGVAKYLSLDASGSQRLFKDEATTFYVNAVEGEQGKYYLWIAEEPEDYSGLESAQTAFSGTTQGEPFSAENVGTRMFRIPAMITLDNGWIVAAADVRWAGWNDNPANLDTIVSVSKDGGQTWEWEVINYFGDHANSVQGLPLSAAFIDPILVQGPNGKVWMAIDVTAADGKSTAGSTGYDSQDRILVTHAPGYVGVKAPTDPAVYTYYVDSAVQSYTLDGADVSLKPIKSSADNAASGYAVDAFMNLYKVTGSAAAREWCKQEGAEKKVQTNLFYKQSAWKVFPTCFIMLRSATVTDDGLVWDDPTFPNLRYEGQTQPFFGVCPGRGAVTESGRILFPVYDNATGGEKTSVIYSDDNGATWLRGERTPVSYGGKTSESQIITLPDGTLRMYCRNAGGNRQASYTDSTDGGVTWSATQADAGLLLGSNCMYSVINVNGVLEGPNGQRYEHVVMASYPEGNGGASDWGNRLNGSLRLGYISGSAGNWTVNWLGEPKLYNGEAGTYFAYSCLTQFGAEDAIVDKFAAIYELNDNATARPNIPVDILYKEFDVAYVLGEGWSLTDGSVLPPEPVTPVNLALNKTVYVSGVEVTYQTGPALAVDGDSGTRWSSNLMKGNDATNGSNPSWIVVDLGEDVDTITGVSMEYYNLVWARNYVVQVAGSDYTPKDFSSQSGAVAADNEAFTGQHAKDADCWTTIKTFTDVSNSAHPTDTLAAADLAALPGDIRYIRLYFTEMNGAAAGNAIGLEELTVMGTRKDSFTVTFTGEGVTESTVTVVDGKTATLPAAPTRAGYTFLGWFVGETEFTASTVVTADITVTAKWEVSTEPPAPQEFTITFNANGGEGSMAAQTVTENVAAALTANAFTRAGYTFTGWNTAANGSGAAYADAASVTATGDMTLYAQWTEIVVPPTTYTVTFTGEGVTQSAVTVTENGTVGAQMPADPVRAGYTFAGWQTADGAAFTADTAVTADVTVVAQWTRNEEPPVPGTTYTVTINGEAFTVNAGETMGDRMPADPVYPGYAFSGWLVEETNEVFTAATPVDRDMTVIPVWSMKVCVVTIGETAISVLYGGTVGDQMPAAPVRAGYTFAGWQTADGKEFTADTVVTGDISVGARWTVTPTGGGSGSRPTPPEEDLNEPDVPLANGPLSFEDVRLADWFYADVAAVFGVGVMKGVSETRFEPGWRLNRGMMAQVIYNLEKDPVATAANPFADVTEGNYYLDAVTWGAEQGVLKGYDNGLYGGEDQVTREQMVLMLYRYSAKKGLDLTADQNALAKFADGAKASTWAADAVRWAVSKGLIQGRSGNLLDPGAAMTRAEVAAILARYVKLLDK